MQNEPVGLVDIETAAKKFGVTTRTIRYWTSKYDLPVIKIGMTIRYDWEVLEKAVKARFMTGKVENN